MLHSLARSMHKPVLWLMLPLAVLAGRPSAGCVCIDGSVKTACCRSAWLVAGLGCNLSEEGDCCTVRDAPCPSCASRAAGEEHTDNGRSDCSPTGACQCHALANNIEPAKVKQWSVADGFAHALASAVLAAQPQVHAAGIESSPRDASHPPDLVVLYQRFTI
jgi:hypothetical protein